MMLVTDFSHISSTVLMCVQCVCHDIAVSKCEGWT